MAYGTVSADIIQSSVPGVSLGAGDATMMKNRFINGDMRISQYNGTSSVAVTNTTGYVIDRWQTVASQASSKFSVQQNAGSITPPAGFTNYLGCTVTSAYSVTSTDFFLVGQRIEGYNTADWNWGASNAKTVTLSAWVYSSLTGTFGGAIANLAVNRSYPFTYSIPVANTWTQISVVVPGDTTGTWNTDNTQSLAMWFSLGTGSTYAGTPGTWAAANYNGATGQTQIVATNGATFYFTGVQIEVGSSATGFEYRLYDQQLVDCQRYYEVGGNNAPGQFESGGTNAWFSVLYKVTKRATPSIGVSAIYGRSYGLAGWTFTSPGIVASYIDTTSAMMRVSGTTGGTGGAVIFSSGTGGATPNIAPFTISAEL